MIDSITRITLNLQETNTMVSIRAKRGDTGRKLLIHLSDGSIPYHISDDCYATFTGKKPDGTKINNACTIENNVIEYEFTDQTCTAVGTMKAEIRLYGADDKMITSACFLVNVYDTVFRDGDEVSSESEMNTLDDLILRANAFLNETGKLLRWQGNWNSETEYEANDLVLYRDMLYVAEEAIAAGTAPGSEEVTAWVPIAGRAGNDYVLTDADKAEIAEMAADLVEVPEHSGEIGKDGFSPIAKVEQTANGSVITITDANGTTTATVTNGKDGVDGEKGEKGEKGDTGPAGPQGETGDPATLIGSAVTYQVGTSATEIPQGVWTESIPETQQGYYLWSRTVHIFNTGEPVTVYAVSRIGMDDLGTVRTVNGVEADAEGNVELTADDVEALPLSGGTMTGDISMAGKRITDLVYPTASADAVSKQYVDDRRVIFSKTIPANWIDSGEYYYIQVAVSGILSTDMPVITSINGTELERKAWRLVDAATTHTDMITFYCYEEMPTEPIQVVIEVMR